MKPRLYHVSDHYVSYGLEETAFGVRPDPRLPSPARRFWRHNGLGPSDHAVVARIPGKLVGFFRYSIREQDHVLFAAGTWVAWSYRRRGLATRLWLRAFDRHELSAPVVSVYAATEAGERFIRSLKERQYLEEID